MYEKMCERIKSIYKNYNMETGMTTLALGGLIVGGLAGLALPLCVGWEVGEHIKKYLELGAVFGTAIKVIGAVGLTSLVGETTVAVGAIGGLVTGGALGAATGAFRESLDDLVSKK